MSEVTHMAGEDGVMPCCGKTPWEADMTDRITISTGLVTCTGSKPELYPPTTDDVKIRYSLFASDEDPFEAEETFNAWLAGTKAEERKAERERIIKLLEDMCIDDYYCQEKGGCDCYDAEIALIKGETND